MKIFTWIGYITTALIIIFAATTLVGFSYIGIKTPQQSAQVVSTLCDDKIEAYNASFHEEDAQKADDQLKAVATDVANINGNEKSPDCVYMRISNALRQGNNDEAEKLGETLKSLAADGHYASTKLYDISSLETTLTMTEHASDTVDTSGPQGRG